ncbi:MAG: hypothetical protein N2559_16225, partial [Anaerolineae bacterium]|nr:hypothetical protein [Anaerolineae bacterium]
AAAIVRWFDQPILRAVMKQDDVRDAYNELRRFPFVRTRVEGLALHDAVRDLMDENLRVQDAERHRELHERVAVYFEKRLEKAAGEEAERLALERLYHRIRADEETGIQLFQEMAEELVRYRLLNRLHALLNDVNTYPLERENSRLWRKYYGARLAHLEARFSDAEKVYQAIAENETAEAKLRAYASCDWSEFLVSTQRLRETGGIERAKRVIAQSLSYGIDSKLIWSYINLGGMYARLAEDSLALESYRIAIRFLHENRDDFLLAIVLSFMQDVYARQGNWKQMFATYQDAFKLISPQLEKSIARSTMLAYWKVAWAWAGRYSEAMHDLQQAESIKYNLGFREFGEDRDFGFLLGMQGLLPQAMERMEKAIDVALRNKHILSEAVSSGFLGAILLKAGQLQDAEKRLLHALELKKLVQAYRDIPEVLVWLGQIEEIKTFNLGQAESYYTQAIDLKWVNRFHFECAALTGLVRVKHAQGDYVAIPPLLAEAEQLAQQYEYNDHLASLRLTQAHIAWEGNAPTWENGFDAALRYYQHALIYALRYNRFLLDEVLSGRPQGTPLRPIIPECLKRGDEGRRMLMALRDWWQTGVNDIGTP